MTSFPALEPVVVKSGSFLVDRILDRAGQVEVGVGDRVRPEDVVARSSSIEKSFTLYLANELDMPNDQLRKHLAKTVGSTVNEGEVIARVRRGLRTAAVRSPATGTLVNVDDANGTVTLTAASGPRELKALVEGVVERIHSDRGVTIRATGARVYGIVGFGNEATGPLVVGVDRQDRELTTDLVKKDWRGAVVLCGMTVGVPVLNRLKEAGVAGVIVGSIAEADVRRFLSPGDGSATPAAFWGANRNAAFSATDNAPFVIVVTEGFGRHPMAGPAFDFLASREGTNVSLHGQTRVGINLARPEIYIAGDGDDAGHPDITLESGRTVRVVDAEHLGTVGHVAADPFSRALSNGVQRDYVSVALENGSTHYVPVSNVEVLV